MTAKKRELPFGNGLNLKEYQLSQGLLRLEAMWANDPEKTIRDVYSIFEGHYDDEIRKIAEIQVCDFFEVAWGSFKLLPKIKLEIFYIELEYFGQKLEMNHNQSLEQVLANATPILERWNRMMGGMPAQASNTNILLLTL